MKAKGIGSVEMARLERSIGQIAGSCTVRATPKAAGISDAAFLPADRMPG